MKEYKIGMYGGKFMPFHKGHRYCVETAAQECEIVTDIVSVGMYIAHFDAVYLTKRSIYLIMAIIGLINWAKLNRDRNVENE